MPVGHLLFEPHLAVSAALARGAALPDCLSPHRPVALYAATLTGDDALCLGRYQHEAQVLGAASASKAWLRRSTGGAALRAGPGVMYVALALHERSSLLQCPPGRLLNRNVRGVLTGLRHAGLQINYFGRDFLSHGSEPVIYVAWDLHESGKLLLEFFVAHSEAWFVPDTQLAYPARNEPALRGRTPTTIDRVQANLSPEALFRAIADGHARGFDVIWSEDSLPVAHAEASECLANEPLIWSSPREEAIGFVSAGVALDADGKIVRVRVAGDFFAHRACGTTLETRLHGATPDPHVVGEAVDAVFARSGYDVEGIRSLNVIRDAILEAAQRAT